MNDLIEFLKTIKYPTLIIISVMVVVCVGEVLWWSENSHKNINLWGYQVTVPESDGIKACNAIKEAVHDKALGLESDKQANYRLLQDDQTSLNELTKLQLEAMMRDKGSFGNANEEVVRWRINGLVEDLQARQQYAASIDEALARGVESINQECGQLLIARSR